MILLWGLTGDGPFDRVCAAVRRRGAEAVIVDQRDTLRSTVELSVGTEVRGRVRVGDMVVHLDDVHAVYWRTYDARRLPAVVAADAASHGQEALSTAWAIEETLTAWLEVTDARVVNRPSDMASNGSKPYQAAILRAHGFDVPRTLLTNDPDAVRRFWTDNGAVIYKSVSGTRSVVSRLGPSHFDRFTDVTTCPTQFQQFLPGRDHRVHVVGDEVFACEVFSDADDYRYAGLSGEPARLESARLPSEVIERCLAVTRSMALHVAGLDLRLAPDGRWFCFEVNPSPGFSYYEAHTGQPIADAVAELLAAGG